MEITTTDGRTLCSPECEPRGEAHENIGFDWLAEKFCRITAAVMTPQGQQTLIKMLSCEEDIPLRRIVDEANEPQYRT